MQPHVRQTECQLLVKDVMMTKSEKGRSWCWRSIQRCTNVYALELIMETLSDKLKS